jgi:tRNA/tmRNA/rRNA uracil-C5-methylase (TrmA/RlmC/RlmD family)
MRPLPDGCEPACPACPHRQWTLEQSLRQKQDFLAAKLAPWAGVMEPVRSRPDAERRAFRSRVRLGARWMNYHWQFGLEPGDDFIAIPRCPVHAPIVNEAAALLANALPPPEVFPLRFYVQSGPLVTLVLKTSSMPPVEWFSSDLAAALARAGVRGLSLNLHPAAGGILFSKNGWRTLWGEDRVQDAAGLWHGRGAFQQLLPKLHEQSLALSEDFLSPAPGDAVMDFYSGIGSSLRRWTRRGVHAIGLEFDGEAIECARLNAPGSEVLRGPCAQRLPQLRAWLDQRSGATRLAYLNPPRTGLEPEVARWLCEEGRPVRIACLSCSAGTLRRDLEQLSSAGYTVRKLVPFDFFPQTLHVETLALVEKQK